MITTEQLRDVVMRANLAPSIHNTQPSRWRMDGGDLVVAADLSVKLPIADPDAMGVGLSCGAAIEATALALSLHGFGVKICDAWVDNDRHSWPGHRIAARLTLRPGEEDGLQSQLEHRFTWRGPFENTVPRLFGWARKDTVLVLDSPGKAWLAEQNDWASFEIMQSRAFRDELTSWMRLSPGHPRYSFDGLSREAMMMPKAIARRVRLVFGPLWRPLNIMGVTKGITAEADVTRGAAVIACFHCDIDESPIVTGRAYMRLCLEAASLGFAGWPMAALSDHPVTHAEILSRFAIGADRRLVQVIRFGQPTGNPPPRARRPISELLS